MSGARRAGYDSLYVPIPRRRTLIRWAGPWMLWEGFIDNNHTQQWVRMAVVSHFNGTDQWTVAQWGPVVK